MHIIEMQIHIIHIHIIHNIHIEGVYSCCFFDFGSSPLQEKVEVHPKFQLLQYILNSMGSLGWEQCYWCWKWEDDMYIPDGVNSPLCGDCLLLNEPPWWPNHMERQRLKVWRLLTKIPQLNNVADVLTLEIAQFLGNRGVP